MILVAVLLPALASAAGHVATFNMTSLAPDVFPDASGQLEIEDLDDGSTRFSMTVEGITPEAVPLTAWIEYGPDREHSLWEYVMPAVPLAPTWAGFSFGTGPEPNNVLVNGTSGSLDVVVDYDVTKPNQGPLVNRGQTDQLDFPAHLNVQQPPCGLDACFRLTDDLQVRSGAGQALGWSYVREFSDVATGFADVDETTGYAKLKKSPRAFFRVVLATHPDRQTHGLHPGFDFLEFGEFNFESLHDFTLTPEPTFAPTDTTAPTPLPTPAPTS